MGILFKILKNNRYEKLSMQIKKLLIFGVDKLYIDGRFFVFDKRSVAAFYADSYRIHIEAIAICIEAIFGGRE